MWVCGWVGVAVGGVVIVEFVLHPQFVLSLSQSGSRRVNQQSSALISSLKFIVSSLCLIISCLYRDQSDFRTWTVPLTNWMLQDFCKSGNILMQMVRINTFVFIFARKKNCVVEILDIFLTRASMFQITATSRGRSWMPFLDIFS